MADEPTGSPISARTSRMWTLPRWLVIVGGSALTVLLLAVVVLAGMVGPRGESTQVSASPPVDQADVPQAAPESSPMADDLPDDGGVPVLYEGMGSEILEISNPNGAGELVAARVRVPAADTVSITELDGDLEQIGNPKRLYAPAGGGYDGVVLLNAWYGSTAFLDVKTTGEWSIELLPMSSVPELTWPFEISGNTEAVFRYTGTAGIVSASSVDLLAVSSYASGPGDWELLVGESDGFSGEIRWTAGPSVIAVISFGDSWTLVSK